LKGLQNEKPIDSAFFRLGHGDGSNDIILTPIVIQQGEHDIGKQIKITAINA
jgi:hypothetical protein